MFTLYRPGITLNSLRRQFEALKRKYARVIAAAVLKPVADEIVSLWDIAVSKRQPKPDPLTCVQKVAKAGFRLQTFKDLHIYIEDCSRYGGFPDAWEIINKLLPPSEKINLSAVLPNRFPARQTPCVFVPLRPIIPCLSM